MTRRKTLKARTPEDLLAVVPIVLGFHPEDSIVMLTFGPPGETFHARVDLPDPDELTAAVTPLLEAATRHGVTRVAFVLYTADAGLGARAREALVHDFGESGFDVVTVLRVDDAQWFRLDRLPEAPGRPFDLAAHPFVAQSVFEGTVTHRSRGALAESLSAVPEAVGQVEGELPAAFSRLDEGQATAETTWIVETIREFVDHERPLPDHDLARLLVAIRRTELRDVAWLQMSRETAPRHAALWTDVLRRTPEELAAAPACLLAFAAWLGGHGALAWCALDRCREVDPGYRMAAAVATLLDQALPPSAWDGSGARSSATGPA